MLKLKKKKKNYVYEDHHDFEKDQQPGVHLVQFIF